MGAVLSAERGDCRFAHWGRASARVLLAALAVTMVFACLAAPAPPPPQPTVTPASAPEREPGRPTRDADLRLYDRVVERVREGDNYYDAAIAEQRVRSFPVRPGFAVRTPTLARVQASLGREGTIGASILLLAALAFAWWRRFGDEGARPGPRRFGTALIVLGASYTLNPYYHVQHELWTGALIALALGLHRPGRWVPAVMVAALALAIRELALPFVLLMGALALWRRDWKEAAAWATLVLAFAALMAWHFSIVAGYARPDDAAGPSWLALRGLSGWVSNVVQSSQLHWLPRWLGGPLVVLAVLGWAGWRTAAGVATTLLLLGYGAAFMIAGRADNFYWGLMITPVLFAGLAFLPMSLRGLWRAATVTPSYRATSNE